MQGLLQCQVVQLGEGENFARAVVLPGFGFAVPRCGMRWGEVVSASITAMVSLKVMLRARMPESAGIVSWSITDVWVNGDGVFYWQYGRNKSIYEYKICAVHFFSHFSLGSCLECCNSMADSNCFSRTGFEQHRQGKRVLIEYCSETSLRSVARH